MKQRTSRFEKQQIHTNDVDVSKSCTHVRFFDTHDFFYSQLHAIFGTFNLHFSVNVYVSGTVHQTPRW